MGVAFDETKDAAKRTRLANERTYLAWWRTGLTSIAVCIGLGRIVPGVTNVTKWPYELVGVGYGVLGVGFMILAHVRVRAVEAAVDRGEFARLDSRWAAGLLAAGTILGGGAILLVIFAPQQRTHTLVDVVADDANLRKRPALRVRQLPAHVALAGHYGTGVVARCDDDVSP